MFDTVYEIRSLFFFPLAFICLWLTLLFIKKMTWKKLETIFKRTQWNWDDQLLKALERPVRYLVLVVSLSLALQWAPEVVTSHWLPPVIIRIAFVVVFSWITDRIATVGLFSTPLLRGLSSTLRNLLKVVLRMGIYSIMALFVLESFGVSITPFLASLGVGSLAVALALQDTLGNLFSGFYLVLDRPIRVDDVIRLEDGTEGRVKNIGWRSTKIELGSGNTVILPNSKLSSSRITNYELPTPEVTFNVTVNVSVKNDMEKVERLVMDVAKKCQSSANGAVHNFHPVVQFQGVSDVGINLSIALRCTRLSEQGKVRHEFVKELVQRFKSEKIDLSAWNRVSFPTAPSEGL